MNPRTRPKISQGLKNLAWEFLGSEGISRTDPTNRVGLSKKFAFPKKSQFVKIGPYARLAAEAARKQIHHWHRLVPSCGQSVVCMVQRGIGTVLLLLLELFEAPCIQLAPCDRHTQAPSLLLHAESYGEVLEAFMHPCLSPPGPCSLRCGMTPAETCADASM